MEVIIATYKNYKYLTLSYTYEKDKNVLEEIKNKAFNLAKTVDVHSPSGRERSFEERKDKAAGGVLAEYATISYLKKLIEEYSLNAEIKSTDFGSAKDQLDIKLDVNGKEKTVEVRSSFSYKTTFQRLFEGAFSIIGWYTTHAKPIEEKKDFYVFVVHYFHPKEILDRLSDKIQTHILGVVSKETLEKIGEDKTLDQYGAQYRVINPIIKAPDVITGFNEILEISK